jgi:hypothetical protein
MTPKQIEKLKKKIADVKRILAAEKRKFGAYDDSRGLRYLPTGYFVKLGDYEGGLAYLKWFYKNFPFDGGFPEFLFDVVRKFYLKHKVLSIYGKQVNSILGVVDLRTKRPFF